MKFTIVALFALVSAVAAAPQGNNNQPAQQQPGNQAKAPTQNQPAQNTPAQPALAAPPAQCLNKGALCGTDINRGTNNDCCAGLACKKNGLIDALTGKMTCA